MENITKLEILDLIGKNPGKLKKVKTINEGENIITVYEINGKQFAVRI